MYTPVMVPKGWGYELIFCNNEQYCGKLLHFVRGRKCSLHYHVVKDETFYVHTGRIEVRTAPAKEIGTILILKAGDCLRLSPGTLHQVTALETSDVFEFSTHDDPEDSIRLVKGD